MLSNQNLNIMLDRHTSGKFVNRMINNKGKITQKKALYMYNVTFEWPLSFHGSSCVERRPIDDVPFVGIAQVLEPLLEFPFLVS